MSYSDHELRGVGGWLAFLVIVLAVLTPLRTIVDTVQIYLDPTMLEVFGERLGLVQGLEVALSAAGIALAWYLAWRLNSVHSRKTIRIVIPGLWILSLGALGLELLVLSVVGGLPVGLMTEAVAPEILRGAVFSGIWTAYLLKSVRVENTYAEPDAEVAEVFT
ncbi:MAG TPA: DUF2569 family protein [Allosphingosinicella sp.]|jgi:hypothetical protein|nr:DUF2569 family protein [Allosphingosinicella sp.]